MIEQISEQISTPIDRPYQNKRGGEQYGKKHGEQYGKTRTSPDCMSDLELENKMTSARACFQAWHQKSYAERAKVLANAARLMHLRVDDFALPVTADMGQLYAQSRGEILLSANIIDFYAKKLQTPGLHKGRSGPLPYVSSSVSGDIDIEGGPVGIVFGVQPLNFPYYQLARFAAPHLLAGNVVMLKHIGCVPLSAMAFERLWRDAGAPEGAFTNLLVSHEQMNRSIDDPRVRNPGCRDESPAATCA